MKTSLAATARRLRAFGPFDRVVANLPILLGLDKRYLRRYALPAGLCYASHHYDAELSRLVGRRGAATLALRGRIRRILGRRLEALADFNQALALAPGDARALSWRGELRLHMEGQAENGFADLRAAGKTEPLNPWPRIWAAASRLASSAGPETFEHLDAAVSIAPSDVCARLLRAEASLRLSRYDAAVADLDAALKDDPSCVAVFILRGRAEIGRGRMNAAEEAFAVASRLDAGAKDYYSGLAGEKDVGDASRRVRAVDSQIRRNPDAAWAYAIRGDMLRSASHGEGDAAGIADLSRSVQLAPKTPWMRACKARALVQDARAAEGIAELKIALAQDPGCAWLHAWLGESYRRARLPKDAIKSFRRSFELNPSSAQAHLWLGRVYCDERLWERGIGEFSKAVDIDSEYGFAYAKRGQALAALQRHAEAVDDFDRSLNLPVPCEREWIFNLRSRSRLAVRDYVGALDDLVRKMRKGIENSWLPLFGSQSFDAVLGLETLDCLNDALAQFPAAGNLWAWRGALRVNLGRREGIEDLDRGISMFPAFAAAYGWRGRAHCLVGQTEKAAADLDEAIRLDAGCYWTWAWRAELRLGRAEYRAAADDARQSLALSRRNEHASFLRDESMRRLQGDGRK